MKLGLLKPLHATAAAVGLLIVGVAGYSPTRAGILDFLEHKDPQAVQSDAPQAGAQAPDFNPAPALTPGQAPNYRAIVRQCGPAVVGWSPSA